MTAERDGAVILVIEDDPATRHVLARELVAARLPRRRGGGRRAPDWSGSPPGARTSSCWTSACRTATAPSVIRLVRREAATPIVILSGRFEEREKVEALERGADDYVTKPFGIAELRARIKVALRHAAGPAGDAHGRLRAGPIEVDVDRHVVEVAGRRVDLTPREFEILKVLLAHQGRIVTKGRLLRAVWGQAYQGEDDYVYVHVSSVRRKLNAADPDLRAGAQIVTEPGVGYRVADDATTFRRSSGPGPLLTRPASWRAGRS